MSSTQIVEQMSAVVIPAKKPKVRKTIKPHPLKGALIDADLQEEIIVGDVVGEVIAEMVSYIVNIPVVVAEVVVVPITPVRDDDEETTMIEINKLKEKLKKQKEEKRRAETAMEWTKTEEKYIANIKTNIVPYKALLLEGIKQRKADIIDDMRIYTERFNEQMEKLKNSAENRQMEYDCLEALDNDEALDCILTDNQLKEECYGYAREEVVTQVVVAPVIKKAVKEVKEGLTMKTTDRWAIIPVGTQFKAKQRDFIRYYKKTEANVVIECNKEGTIVQGSPKYAGNQAAANAFRIIANIQYSISGWEFLQLYNNKTDKAKSLKKWNGEVKYLNW
jgi:hypothetical protein